MLLLIKENINTLYVEYDVHDDDDDDDDDDVDDDHDFCKIIPFSILLPQTSTQVKCYGDETN